MILSQIVAIAKNRVMGVNNTLPWHIPEDMKFFREKTKNHIMIMGRKTFESLKSPLPNRLHIVITNQKNYSYQNPLVKITHSLQDAIKLAEDLIPPWPEEVYIIGGSGIFYESFPFINKIYISLIHQDFEGDTFYPEVPTSFTLQECKEIAAQIPFALTTWIRKS